jgi:Alanine racemase
MGRMGVVQNEAREVFQRVAAMANVEIHSISTHMPVSNEDAEYTRDQLVRFQRIVTKFAQKFREIQGARVAKRRDARVQSADLRNRARRYHALRHFAAPGIS